MTATAQAGTAGRVRPGRTWFRRTKATDEQRLRLGSGLSLGVVVLWLSILVLLPLAAVVGKAFDDGWSGFWAGVTSPEALAAFRLTVGLAFAVAVVNAIMGTLVAWVLVRDDFRGKGALNLVIDVPFALPTVVAGLVMFTLYGGLSPIGVHLNGTRWGIVIPLLFVTLPFTVRTVQPVLLDLERDVEEAAASLGASPFAVFRRVVLPPILPAMLSGGALSFARALGEYGSIVFLSSNIPFKTEIASSYIYAKLQDSNAIALAERRASVLATELLLASVIVLILIGLVERRAARRG